jgi:hypothetical protein
MSADPRIATPKEREGLAKKLGEIDPRLVLSLEEEIMDGYETTLARLKFAGLEVNSPLKHVYKPIRETLRKQGNY